MFAIILAAGESRRFGSSKQLGQWDGRTLVGHAVRLAEEVCGDRCVLVVGSDWIRVLAACRPQRGFFVRNENFLSGMASSIACGIKSVADVADAVLLLMADQPLVTAEHLTSLIAEWKKTTDYIIVSEYSGMQGPPVVFPAHCFDKLMRLKGDRGARSLVNGMRESVRGYALGAAGADIDTPEDLEKLQSA